MKNHNTSHNFKIFGSFFRIGAFMFGGGLAMLPLLTREIVAKRGWTTEEQLLDYYAIGQCTPGVIAVNTATFIGYDQNGFIGAFFATLGVISPSLLIITLIAALLTRYMDLPVVVHALSGIRIVVCGLLLNTVIGLIRTGVKGRTGWILFGAAAVLSFFSPIPTVVIILGAGAVGALLKSLEAKRS